MHCLTCIPVTDGARALSMASAAGGAASDAANKAAADPIVAMVSLGAYSLASPYLLEKHAKSKTRTKVERERQLLLRLPCSTSASHLRLSVSFQITPPVKNLPLIPLTASFLKHILTPQSMLTTEDNGVIENMSLPPLTTVTTRGKRAAVIGKTSPLLLLQERPPLCPVLHFLCARCPN